MFLNYQPKKCEVRPNRKQAPCMLRISGEGFHSPFPITKPRLSDYAVYGPVRNVTPIRTASGYPAHFLLSGVQNMATVASARTVVDKQESIQSAIERNFAEWMEGVAVSSDATAIISHPHTAGLSYWGKMQCPPYSEAWKKNQVFWPGRCSILLRQIRCGRAITGRSIKSQRHG